MDTILNDRRALSSKLALALVGTMFFGGLIGTARADDPGFTGPRGMLPADGVGGANRVVQPTQPQAAQPADGTHFYVIEQLRGYRMAFPTLAWANYYIQAF